MSVKPDCMDCTVAWDRSNNAKGVVFCDRHDLFNDLVAELKQEHKLIDCGDKCSTCKIIAKAEGVR